MNDFLTSDAVLAIAHFPQTQLMDVVSNKSVWPYPLRQFAADTLVTVLIGSDPAVGFGEGNFGYGPYGTGSPLQIPIFLIPSGNLLATVQLRMAVDVPFAALINIALNGRSL